jgi:hypothetical protein
MLCRKLTNPGTRTPAGKAKLHVHKWLSVDVGGEPTTDVQKNDVFGIMPERSVYSTQRKNQPERSDRLYCPVGIFLFK